MIPSWCGVEVYWPEVYQRGLVIDSQPGKKIIQGLISVSKGIGD